jgi:hypothetical protein
MITAEYVLVSQLCTHYQVEQSFFSLLHENGWIETIVLEETTCVHQDALPKIEKILRLHQNLELNIEGIDVVLNLLDKIETMQEELQVVKSKLKRYE